MRLFQVVITIIMIFDEYVSFDDSFTDLSSINLQVLAVQLLDILICLCN